MNFQITVFDLGIGAGFKIASNSKEPAKADDLIKLLKSLDELKVDLANATAKMVQDPTLTLESCLQDQNANEMMNFIKHLIKTRPPSK